MQKYFLADTIRGFTKVSYFPVATIKRPTLAAKRLDPMHARDTIRDKSFMIYPLSDILSLKGISFLGINKQVDFIPCPKK